MKIGKASLEIKVEGCIKCGTKWSRGWSVAKVVTARIGQREIPLTLYICADCEAAETKKGMQTYLL